MSDILEKYGEVWREISRYEAQVNHYTNFIQSHPGWELAGIFADEGLSGTQAKTRP